MPDVKTPSLSIAFTMLTKPICSLVILITLIWNFNCIIHLSATLEDVIAYSMFEMYYIYTFFKKRQTAYTVEVH